MSPLVERIFTASRITVRLAPNFLPSSASMGSGFPAGNSPRTMDEPSFCTSDWVRLMVPDMCRYASTTARDSESLIRLIAETPGLVRSEPLRLARTSSAPRGFHRLHRPVVRLGADPSHGFCDAEFLEDRDAQGLGLGTRDAPRMCERHLERSL